MLKYKDKKIQKLDQKDETLQQRIKALKLNSGKFKFEKEKAEKALDKLKKKVKVNHEKQEGKIIDLEHKHLARRSETNSNKSVEDQ